MAITQLIAAVVLPLAVAQQEPPSVWEEFTPRQDGKYVVFSRLGPPAEGPAKWISLGELTTWRSPRGLDYKIDGDTLVIWPWDGTGQATIELSTGRTISARGTLASLSDNRLERVERLDFDRFFFTTDRVDFLVEPNLLRDYFGDLVRSQDRSMQLRFTPAIDLTDEILEQLEPRAGIMSYVYMPAAVFDDGVLLIAIELQRIRVSLDQRRLGVLEYQAHLRNLSGMPIVIQPARLAPSLPSRPDEWKYLIGTAVPAVSSLPVSYSTSRSLEAYYMRGGIAVLQGVWAYGGLPSQEPTYAGQTRVLAPNETATLRGRIGFWPPGPTALAAENYIFWRYSDGYRTLRAAVRVSK